MGHSFSLFLVMFDDVCAQQAPPLAGFAPGIDAALLGVGHGSSALATG
jgi:hypothetical protein